VKRSDEELDHLLLRGRLSGAARERALEGALRAAVPRRARWSRWAGLLAPAAALVALLVLWPRTGFTPKGGVAQPVLLDVACADGAHACRAGDTLVFQVASAQGGLLAAWAEPLGGGERVWYFPASDGHLVSVAAQPTIQILKQGIRLGPAQPPGAYLVHLVLTRRALDRAELLAARPDDVLGASSVRIDVAP
jgi:hypothetical protein